MWPNMAVFMGCVYESTYCVGKGPKNMRHWFYYYYCYYYYCYYYFSSGVY